MAEISPPSPAGFPIFGRLAGTSPRGRLLAVAVGLAAVTSIGLVGEAIRTARQHKRVANQVVRDYARTAGWLFATAYRAAIELELAPALGPMTAGPGSSEFSPRAVRQVASEVAHCPNRADDIHRVYFTSDVRTGVVRTDGADLDPAVLPLIRDSVVMWSGNSEARWGILSHGAMGSTRRALIFAVRRDHDGHPAAVVGFDTCQRWFFDELARVRHAHPLLPPQLVAGIPTDSVLSVVVVRDRARDTVYRSPVQYPATYAATTPSFGVSGLSFSVAINPAVATRLVIGGLPQSRLPWLLTLLGLSVTALVTLFIQVRRELAFSRARTDFVSSVSHEIRTPLAQILLFGESLKLGSARNAEERRFAVDVIVEEARRLIHLVENLLHFSRARTRRVSARLEPVRLAPIVRHVISAFAPLARHRDARFVVELNNDISATTDPDAVRQILINLLDNAVKFGPDHHEITVGGALVGTEVHLTVSDRGPGIPRAEWASIWRPFTRIAPDPTRSPGSGIGLAVVADLVADLRARAWVEDRTGGGTTIAVALPGAPNSEAAPPETSR